MVFEIWDSQATFEAFGRTVLPIVQELGLDRGRYPAIVPIHNVVT